MYLNLDLLYNVNKYLYPLFYYKNAYWGGYCIYSSMTKKFIIGKYIYYDVNSINYIFTENRLIHNGFIFNKCKPFNLTKKEIVFLKNNIRIN